MKFKDKFTLCSGVNHPSWGKLSRTEVCENLTPKMFLRIDKKLRATQNVTP
jgi:hypothetical protein